MPGPHSGMTPDFHAQALAYPAKGEVLAVVVVVMVEGPAVLAQNELSSFLFDKGETYADPLYSEGLLGNLALNFGSLARFIKFKDYRFQPLVVATRVHSGHDGLVRFYQFENILNFILYISINEHQPVAPEGRKYLISIQM